ncbi:hypothetical protein J6590_016880 [Homalodisca vitripennis]|nr:hypothetical protein J6590_016880 [Homalodisca vitripennis]
MSQTTDRAGRQAVCRVQRRRRAWQGRPVRQDKTMNAREEGINLKVVPRRKTGETSLEEEILAYKDSSLCNTV